MGYLHCCDRKKPPMPDDKAKVPAFLEAVDPEDEIGAGFESSAIVQQRCFDRLGELVSWSESCAEKTKTVFWFEPRLVVAVFSHWGCS
jgi:hypothetical protein